MTLFIQLHTSETSMHGFSLPPFVTSTSPAPAPTSLSLDPAQVAKDFMTRENTPDTPCAFCLDNLAASSNGATTPLLAGSRQEADEKLAESREGTAPSLLLQLPCFHTFHTFCFERWWVWQQADWGRQEREMVAHTGATSVATLLAVRREEGGRREARSGGAHGGDFSGYSAGGERDEGGRREALCGGGALNGGDVSGQHCWR